MSEKDSAIKKDKSKTHRKQAVKDEYIELYPFLKKKDDHHMFCNTCRSVFSITHGEVNDIKVHINSNKHKSAAQEVGTNTKLDTFGFFTKCDKTPLTEQVTSAELLMTSFIIEHNLPIAIADHFSPLMEKMFPDSKIGKEFASKRTKTTKLVHTIAEENVKELEDILQNCPFSVSTDGSADRGGKSQMYPVCIRYFNPNVQKVITEVLGIPVMKKLSSTGENIFELLQQAMETHGLKWNNCVTFCSDNAAVMMGVHKGVAAFVKKENPSVFLQGCTCHLTHIAASNAAKELPVSPDVLLTDLYYFLDKSSKRHKQLEELQELFGTGTKKIMKHCATRWLSLSSCIERLLQQWAPLMKFIDEQMASKPDKKTKDDAKGTSGKKKATSRTAPQVSHERTKTTEKKRKAESTSENTKKKPTFSFKSLLPSSQGTGPEKCSDVKKKVGSTASVPDPAKKTGGKSGEPPSKKRKVSSDGSQNVPVSTSTSDSSKPSVPAQSSSKEDQIKQLTRGVPWGDRLKRIHSYMHNPMTKATLLFLKSTQSVFDELNLLLQKDEPQVHVLMDHCIELLTNLLIRFLKPEAIHNASSIFTVDYKSRSNQKSREMLLIGAETKSYLSEMKECNMMTTDDRTEFYTAVRQYYVKAVEYILAKFPIHDELLEHAKVADIRKRKESSFECVKYFVDRFPVFAGVSNKDELDGKLLDGLEMEFLKYQIDKEVSFDPDARIDSQWAKLSERYPKLSNCMLGILSIPHSNADSERVFSCVRRADTEFRPNLGIKTLESLIVNKVHMQSHDTCCYKQKYSKDFLKKAKSASYVHLKGSAAVDNESATGPLRDVSGQILKYLSHGDELK